MHFRLQPFIHGSGGQAAVVYGVDYKRCAPHGVAGGLIAIDSARFLL
ncbi:MAG: hypothetical protein ABSA26_06755 [Thermoguttaceae bacterium]